MDVTVYDVAKKAGVSVYTAMRALNGTTKMVRNDARERATRIMTIAKSMNYHPNNAARTLATRKTGNLGFILSEDVEGGIGNKYYANLLSGVENVCRKNGYGLHFGIGNLLEIENFVYPKSVAGQSVDGVFLAGSVITPLVIKQFEKLNIPCMCFSHCEIDSETVFPIHRNSSWFETMFKLCFDYGHRKVGIIELDCRGSRKRRESVKPWLDKHKMEYIPLAIENNNTEDNTEELIAHYFSLAEKKRPTVIAGAPDICMAMINKLSERGINCPNDLSFICAGNDDCNPYFRPHLSGIDFDTRTFSKLATKAMLDHLQNKKPLKKMDIIPEVKVIIGESLKKIKE